MNLFKKIYIKDPDAIKSKTDTFLIDLMKYLQAENNFYKINDIVVEESEKETQYTASILFLSKAQEKKKYVLPKKTDDKESQIPTEAVKEVSK